MAAIVPITTVSFGNQTYTFTNDRTQAKGNGYVLMPSSYSVEYEDVSAADAGRTEDGTMWKLKIGVVRKISLEWQNIDSRMLENILNAFNSEYFQVTFYDPRKASGAETSTFYVGNRTMPLYNGALNIWSSLQLNLIERSVYNG